MWAVIKKQNPKWKQKFFKLNFSKIQGETNLSSSSTSWNKCVLHSPLQKLSSLQFLDALHQTGSAWQELSTKMEIHSYYGPSHNRTQDASPLFSGWKASFMPLCSHTLLSRPLAHIQLHPSKEEFREDVSCHKSPPSTKDFREIAKEVMVKGVQEVWKHFGEGKALTHNCTEYQEVRRESW